MKDIIDNILSEMEIQASWNDQGIQDALILPGPEKLVAFMTALWEREQLYFDMLSCITGIDNGPEAGTMEVIYNLFSIPYEQSLTVNVQLTRENPEIPSVTGVWKTADWLERETYDMLGIRFEGHPDLRRILLPADWEGYPLRKDYKEQEYYHGIRVAY